MRKSLHKSFIAASALALIIAVAPAGVVSAHGGSHDAGSSHSHGAETAHSDDSVRAAGVSDDSSEGQSTVSGDDHGGDRQRSERRLDASKKRICERRERVIENIMGRSRERAQKQLTLFSTITARTQAFYTEKGKTLANYDELVAAVNTAKATAEADLAALPASFDCNGSDPKGAAEAFKTALKKEVVDLKAYRQAVKNLIAGVKSVQGDE